MFSTEDAAGTTYFNFEKDTLYLRVTNTANPRTDEYFDLLRYVYDFRCITESRLLNRVENLGFPPTRHTVKFTYSVQDLELHLARLFNELFPNLKNFTLVLRDYHNQNSSSSDIFLMEPIDLDKILNNYQEIKQRIKRRIGWEGTWFLKTWEWHKESKLYIEWAQLNAPAFQWHMSEQRKPCGSDVEEKTRAMPKITSGVAVSRETKESLELLRTSIRNLTISGLWYYDSKLGFFRWI